MNEFVLIALSDRKLIKLFKKSANEYVSLASRGFFASANFTSKFIDALAAEIEARGLTDRVVR